MNLKIQPRNLDLSSNLTRLIDKKAEKVRRMLPTFPGEVVDLHVTIEKLPRGNQHQSVLVLNLPQKAIRVEAIEDNPASSIQRTFSELLRRIKKFKSRLNREQFWQRQPGRVITGPATEETRELENAINLNLDKIDNYVRRELFYRAAMEGLPHGLLQSQAVVDEVFLRVSSGVASRPENLDIEQWMYQVARETVEERVASLVESKDEAHMEEISSPPSMWPDEMLNFHQPDEVLHLEDLVADTKSVNPEDLLARDEIEEELQKQIALLPKTVRDSFVLYAMEGFDADEVAMITGRTPEEVLRHVEEARVRLRSHMQQLGAIPSARRP